MTEHKTNTLYRTIGTRINEARKAKNLSQEELARKTGVSRTSIVNIERGRQRLPLHLLWQIASELNAEPSTFIPSSHEITNQPVSQSINNETIHIIEKKSQGNLETRRKLIEFFITAG